MSNFRQMVQSFQTQIHCCDDRIKSILRQERTWDHPQIAREMAHRSGLILGATIAGIRTSAFEMETWTAPVINKFLAELDD